MNKRELIEAISKHSGISQKQVGIITTELLNVISSNLEKGSKIKLRGFGTFKRVNRSKRSYYNFSTQSVKECPTTQRVKFHPSDNFKKTLYDTKVSPKEVKTTSSGYHSYSGGSSIIEGELNLKTRRENKVIENPAKIEYDGTVSTDRSLGMSEHKLFPAIKTPTLGTAILKPQKISHGSVTGITEPLLAAELRELCERFPDLTIIENVAIPIKGWSRPFIPDFVLHHKTSNLYIDIEIDEPYDIQSRKPIHFIGGNDLNRDNYLVSNGWVVIRYSEHQVCKHINDVIEHLYNNIYWLLGKDVNSCSLPIEDRWTFEKAEELAKKNYREKYLGIIPFRQSDRYEVHIEEEPQPKSIHLELNTRDAENQINTDETIRNQIDYIMSFKPEYVRVTLKDTRQFILNGDTFKADSDQIWGIISFRYNGINSWKIDSISTLEPLNCLFTDISWRKTTHRLVCDPTCRPILIDAAFNGAPIWIRYKHQGWDDPSPIEYETFISCLYLSSDPPSLNYGPCYKHAFTEILGWKEPAQCFYINGNRLRQFHIDNCDLLEIKVVNCINDFQNINVYKDSLKELILNPCRYSKKERYHERVETLLTKRNKFPINDLLFLKLRAHYETIKGNIEEALNLYHSIDYNFRVDYDEFASIWGHSCIKDINLYIKQTENLEDSRDIKEISPKDLRQNFSTIKDMLIVKGWSWFNT